MRTTFYYKAIDWTEQSQVDWDNKKYLSSWANTIPAKLNYLADAVANVALGCFNLFPFSYKFMMFITGKGKAMGPGVPYLYFLETANAIRCNINHIVCDMFGIAFIKVGKDLHNNSRHGFED